MKFLLFFSILPLALAGCLSTPITTAAPKLSPCVVGASPSCQSGSICTPTEICSGGCIASPTTMPTSFGNASVPTISCNVGDNRCPTGSMCTGTMTCHGVCLGTQTPLSTCTVGQTGFCATGFFCTPTVGCTSTTACGGLCISSNIPPTSTPSAIPTGKPCGGKQGPHCPHGYECVRQPGKNCGPDPWCYGVCTAEESECE